MKNEATRLDILHRSDVDALVDEMRTLSDQLAQRTVLYSAQERRWHDSSRQQQSLESELRIEVDQLRGRLQQTEAHAEKADKERIEALLNLRQQNVLINELETKLSDVEEKIVSLDNDLSEANALNHSLQLVVDSLRGSDLDEYEKNLASELLRIRNESKLREDNLLRQLEDSQRRLAADVDVRQRLIDDVSSLRAQLEEKNELLRDIQLSEMHLTFSESAGIKSLRYKDDEAEDEPADPSTAEIGTIQTEEVSPSISSLYGYLHEVIVLNRPALEIVDWRPPQDLALLLQDRFGVEEFEICRRFISLIRALDPSPTLNLRESRTSLASSIDPPGISTAFLIGGSGSVLSNDRSLTVDDLRYSKQLEDMKSRGKDFCWMSFQFI